MKILQLFLIAALFAISSVLVEGQTADLVVTNAKIWTVNAAQPSAQSIAVLNGKIVAIGSNSDTRGFVGPKTRVGLLTFPVNDHEAQIKGAVLFLRQRDFNVRNPARNERRNLLA